MERNFSCSMKTLHELCGSHFCKEIGKKIASERRDEVRRSYGGFLGDEEKTKWLDVLKTRSV